MFKEDPDYVHHICQYCQKPVGQFAAKYGPTGDHYECYEANGSPEAILRTLDKMRDTATDALRKLDRLKRGI